MTNLQLQIEATPQSLDAKLNDSWEDEKRHYTASSCLVENQGETFFFSIQQTTNLCSRA